MENQGSSSLAAQSSLQRLLFSMSYHLANASHYRAAANPCAFTANVAILKHALQNCSLDHTHGCRGMACHPKSKHFHGVSMSHPDVEALLKVPEKCAPKYCRIQ